MGHQFAVKPISLTPDFSQVATGNPTPIDFRLLSRRYDLITTLKCGANENLKVNPVLAASNANC
jgi:hypothetical protein